MSTIIVTTESGTTYTINEEKNTVVRKKARVNRGVPERYNDRELPLVHVMAKMGESGYLHFGRSAWDYIHTTPIATVEIDGAPAEEYEYDIEVDV